MNPLLQELRSVLLACCCLGTAFLSVRVLRAAPNEGAHSHLSVLTNDPAADPYCTPAGPQLDTAAPSTRRMAALLARLARESDPRTNIFLNHRRAEMFIAEARALTNSVQLIETTFYAGMELLNAGETKAALEQFERVGALHELHPMRSALAFSHELRKAQALAYMRLGEQENCLAAHNPDSCLLPIQGGGVHTFQRGSRQAIEILEAGMSQVPGDLAARWLLNLAYMTIGAYPAQVPEAWLIPPVAFESEYDIKRFPDIAEKVGLDLWGHAGGTIVEDFDNDGNLDIMVSDSLLRAQLRCFRNNVDGTFTDCTRAAGLTGLVGGLNIIQGDYNNDGLPDVLVLRGGWMKEAGHCPPSLLRNDGNGHFTDVTEESGLLAFHPTQTAVWFDFDGDGWLDIYLGYESYGSDIRPCALYRNNHDGTFTECAAAAGVAAVGYVKAVVSGDFNNDGRPDLYLSRRGQSNILYRNDGPSDSGSGGNTRWRFTDVSQAAGVADPVSSFPAWFFDYDNDGWPDIFVSGYFARDVGDVAADYLGQRSTGEAPRLYHNNHDGTFSDVTRAAHLQHVLLTMGSNFGDLDNDGWLDLFLGTGGPDLSLLDPARVFRNAGGKCFQDVTTAGGFGNLQKGHGVSFGDLDNDGDQDILHSVGGAYEGDWGCKMLFENPGHGNHWITLKLEGVQCNRIAIGARIRVIVDTAEGERSVYRTVGTGGSFGANPLRQEIGLGAAKAIRRIEIFWPVTKKTQLLTGMALDHFYRVREGDDHAVLWPLPKFTLGARPAAAGVTAHR